MRVVSAARAVDYVRGGDTLLIGGSGGGHAVPELLLEAVEKRFLAEGTPQDITLVFPVGLGDEESLGVGRLAHKDLLKRVVTSTLVDSPLLAELAKGDLVETYILPLGVLSQIMRDLAAGRPGLITKVGLDTFIDPRRGGGRQTPSANAELVELMTIDGEEWLRYKPYHFDVAFLRGTTADEDGNVTMEHEAIFGDVLSMAQATRGHGGMVIVQVERLAQSQTLPAKNVKIPGVLVDLVVIDPAQRQTYATEFNPAYAGEMRVPPSTMSPLEFGTRKIIARRAAMELFPGAVCNLGYGVSNGIADVGCEEGILGEVVLSNEQGLIGGAPASGTDAGAATNYSAMIDMAAQFDFYDGGGLDLAFLSFAEVDGQGSVNVSRFGGRLGGVGGFVNISHGARRVVFSGTFTSGGLEVSWEGRRFALEKEGRHRKFVDEVEELCFSGEAASARGQVVMYVTERAVFELGEDGLTLIEVAPGVDLERDIFAKMGFVPQVADPLREMDKRLFDPTPMGLAADVLSRMAQPRSVRLAREAGMPRTSQP